MERLTPDDASVLQMEDDTHAMHHVTVAVFEGPEPAYRDLYDRIASRVSLVPRLRQRVLDVPFGIARPVWIDDAQFTLEDHLRRTDLPSDDDPGALPDLVGRLLSHQLDRGRPLWTMWLVSGLPHDRFAVISQAHMAMVDGVSGTDPLALVTDQMHAACAVTGWHPRSRPSDLELVRHAALDLAWHPADQVRLVRRRLEDPLRRAVALMATARRAPAPSGLVGPVGPHRRWHHSSAAATAVGRIRDQLDVATGDVVLALTTWGFRRMLLHRSQGTPPDTLRALVPLATATGDRFTNDTRSLVADLPVGVDDVVLAVHLISQQTRRLPGGLKAVAGANLSDLAGLHAPTLSALGLRSAEAAGVKLRHNDTVVVNAPGPRDPVTMLGRPLVGLLPAVPLVPQVRIAVGVMSHGEQFSFGITGDRDSELDIAELARGIDDAVDLLSRARGDRRTKP